ncbi:hypothetical protein [Geodermatophilus normandii]|uniref:Uncharacterized protein n=1 Tax=Geodermatophilus normandii TaxID=1137989 RepID=A0A6P0G964_9ACTN|nr:hypothetical protein [Geodermatophilus normandii]NEM04593.1 hypothetical protein [Geodermatophilus normandii]
MRWAVVSVVGFFLVTGLVTAMARSNTARWERDHRAAQAAARARAETARSGWVAALGHRAHGDGAGEDRPHLHLPHVHLPAGLVARLPHPHVHLPHVHLPQVHLPWRSRPAERLDEPPRAGADAGSQPASGT